ncbi:MAG: response regulator [Desulfobacula sp.]|nr:response regulator [Desulfobacula sp.]
MEKNITKKAKILIVEDERIVALAIEEALVSMGYQICGNVAAGNSALEMIPAVSPDLVMMDIKIKGSMDGIETAQHLRKQFDIPVVFLTAFSDETILDQAKLVQPAGYVLKPFKFNELKSVVEIALYKIKMEKKLRQAHHELEQKVKDRTQKLTDEIAYRKTAEKSLKRQTDYLLQANKALKSMLENREAEQRAIEEQMLLNIKRYALPYIEMIEQMNPKKDVLMTLEMLKQSITELVSPASKRLFSKYINLTPREIQIADLIRHGKKSKEIALLLNITPSSVSTYRNHIRKKIGLLNTCTNLETYLNSLNI